MKNGTIFRSFHNVIVSARHVELSRVHNLCNYIHPRSLKAEHFCTDNDCSLSGRKGNGQTVSFVSICGSITALFRWLYSWHHAYGSFTLLALALFALLKKENYLVVGRSILGQCSAWVS